MVDAVERLELVGGDRDVVCIGQLGDAFKGAPAELQVCETDRPACSGQNVTERYGGVTVGGRFTSPRSHRSSANRPGGAGMTGAVLWRLR
jgi:hypothetical protein